MKIINWERIVLQRQHSTGDRYLLYLFGRCRGFGDSGFGELFSYIRYFLYSTDFQKELKSGNSRCRCSKYPVLFVSVLGRFVFWHYLLY